MIEQKSSTFLRNQIYFGDQLIAAADARQRNRLLTVLFVGVLMGALDLSIIGPVFKAISTMFSLIGNVIAWTFTIYVLFNLVGTLLMAKLSDRFGRRTIYIIDVTLFALGSLVVALAPTFWIIIVGRAVQGFGAGGIFPVAAAVIGDTFPPEKRGSAIGLIGAVFGIAFLIGPVLAFVLLIYDWRYLFYINLPIAAGIIAAGWRYLPSIRSEAPCPIDWGGIISVSLLLTCLTLGITLIDPSHILLSIASPGVWGFLAAAVVFLVIFVQFERRVTDPVLHLSLFSSRQAKIAGILAWGTAVGEAALVFIPALLVLAYSVSTSISSLMLLPIILAMSVGSPLAGRLVDRRGSKFVVLMGATIATVGMIELGILGEVSLVWFYGSSVLIGIGLGFLLGAPVRYIMLSESPPEERAIAQGSLSIFSSMGNLVSGALVGTIIFSAGGGIAGNAVAFLVIAGVMAFLLFVGLALKGQIQEQADGQRFNQTVLSPQPKTCPT